MTAEQPEVAADDTAADPTDGGTDDSIFPNDVARIVTFFAVLYLGYVLVGLVAGLSIRGILATLVDLTLLVAIYAMLTLALNLHWGYTGLFNIGIVGFMAVGAYTMLILSKPPASTSAAAVIGGFGLPLPIGMLGGTIVAALLGLVVALPALRLRADYLAITTIALSEIVRFVVQSGSFAQVNVLGRTVGTGGGAGLLVNFDEPFSKYLFSSGAFDGFVESVNGLLNAQTTYAPIIEGAIIDVFLLAVVAVYYWLFQRTGKSPFGRVLKAIREDEDVARALGKDTNMFKIKSFMLGCALMGFTGALYAVYFLGSVNPTAFKPQFTFFVWVALIVGGAGSNTGSVLGSAIFVGVLFQGPLYTKSAIQSLFEVGSAPDTIAGAIGGLLSLDVTPLIAYVFENMSLFRIITLGVVLIWLMKRRPDGLLGDRKETASVIPLRSMQRRGAETGGDD